MPNSNKHLGNVVERNICNIYSASGYWVHLFRNSANGQPCDIIAAKRDVVYLVDAKRCTTNTFTFDRIEPNQRMCFEYAYKCGITRTGFVIYCEEDKSYRYLSYKYAVSCGKNSVRISELPLLKEVI